MNRILFFVMILIFFSCKKKNKVNEQKIFDRITFVYNLKQTVEETTWKTFNNKEYDLPLIYFTDTSSYIANPTTKFLNTFKSELVFEDRQIKIYKTKRIDSIQFHMETGLTMGEPTDKYNYHSPFMNCSSYEEAHKTIPKINATEQWATLIMHEYFHGYQYKHKAYIEYYEKEIVQIQPDSLIALYKNNDWFKKSIDQENQLLLNALNEKDSLKTSSLIKDFFKLRNQRRKIVLEKLNFDISTFEKCYETMEGTARYVEFSLYNTFSTRRPDYKLLKSDSSFKSFEKYHKYDIKKDEWLYLSEKTSYFYATGFNIVRLLDKLKIEYKSILFRTGEVSAEDLLNHHGND